MAPRRVCLGVITGAHGVRGEVRLRPYTAEPDAVDRYGEVEDARGERRYALDVIRVGPRGVVARIAGVADRDAALALRGVELWVPRERLPAPEPDEWYVDDLKGLAVVDGREVPFGRVRAVVDHGGGDVVEITTDDGRELVLPFTAANFPEVDVAAGRIVAVLPEELEAAGDRR
jgi:16S rRNA processing protein RimM